MGKEAKKFWSSPAARNFPYSIEIDGKVIDLHRCGNYTMGIRYWLREHHLIPEQGFILDVGSGATTVALFGEEHAHRSFAADISADLLLKNPLPFGQKIQMDIGHDVFPRELEGKVTLVTSICCARYLENHEKEHLARSMFQILAPGGTVIVVDFTSAKPFVEVMGEVSAFDPRVESAILEHVGFQDVQVGSFWIEVYNAIGPTNTDWAQLHFALAKR